MLELHFSSRLDWGSYIFSIAKTSSFLDNSVNLPYCLAQNIAVIIWAGAPCCHLKMLNKLQKWIYRTVGPSLVGSSFTLVDVTCSSELAQLVPIPYFLGNSIYYSDWLHDFLSPILDVIKLSMSTVSFLAQLESGILCLQNASFWPMI